MHRIVHRIGLIGGTFSAKKLVLCADRAEVVGHVCTYEGRIVDPARVQRIQDWPECRSLTEVRAFLGTLGYVRIFIPRFAFLARPLIELTKKGVEFEFGEAQLGAMEALKAVIVESPALRPIDYECGREVILAVDSSIVGVGFLLMQIGEDGKRYPSRFGSIAWNDRECNYSQAKSSSMG